MLNTFDVISADDMVLDTATKLLERRGGGGISRRD